MCPLGLLSAGAFFGGAFVRGTLSAVLLSAPHRRYIGEIIRESGGDAILTLFVSIISRIPGDFVLYFPILFLNEKQIVIDSMDE